MTDSDRADRPAAIDRATARIEAMQAELALRRDVESAMQAELDALRRDVESLEQSQDDDRRGLAAVRQEVLSLRSGQDSLTTAVGEMRCEQLGLLAQVAALSAKVPTGGAVIVAGGAAGVPALALLLAEVWRAIAH